MIRHQHPAPRILPSFREWIAEHRDELDAVVLDVDGVLTIEGHSIPGAAETVARLRERGMLLSLLTNDPTRSVGEKLQVLEAIGLSFGTDEVTSSAHGLAEFAERYGVRGELFFAAGRLGSPSYADLAGLRITRDAARIEECRGFILTEHDYDWESTINAALNYFRGDPDALLAVPNPDDYYMIPGGRIEIGSGGVARFIARICTAAGRPLEPIFLGKPYSPIFLHSHHQLEQRAGRPLPHDRVLIVGDSLASDIAGGNAFGYRTALVLTGVSTERMIETSPNRPELVFRRL